MDGNREGKGNIEMTELNPGTAETDKESPPETKAVTKEPGKETPAENNSEITDTGKEHPLEKNSEATEEVKQSPNEKELYPPTSGKNTTLAPIKGAPTTTGMYSTPMANIPSKTEDKPIGEPPKGPDNSLLHFLGRLGIVIVVGINILSFLLGIGLVVVGAIVNKELNKAEDVMELLDLIDLGNFTLKQLIITVITVVIILGVCGIITSLLGGCGAFFTLRVMLIVYIVIVVMVMLLELTMLGIWIDFLNKIDTTLRGWFYSLLEQYKGPGVLDLYSLGWDLLFVYFGCCGVDPITATQNDFQTVPSEWWSSGDHGNDLIPYSCCQNVAVDSIENYLNYTDIACTENLRRYHTSGCYDFFSEILTQLASIAITIMSLLFLVELVAVVFSFIIICAVTMKKKVGIV